MLKSKSVKIAQEMLVSLLQRNSEYRYEYIRNNFYGIKFESVDSMSDYDIIFDIINKSGKFKAVKYSKNYIVIKPTRFFNDWSYGLIMKIESHKNLLNNKTFYSAHLCEKRYIKGFHSLED